MCKVSIIVPVYNVERYLKRCVESIVSQTLKDLEIILVDDGSPDHSGKICDELKEKDNRIVVIHQENKGLPGARNSGMKIAHGEYIGFVDSDDYIDNDMYERMYITAKDNQADVVMCDFLKEAIIDNEGKNNNNQHGTRTQMICDIDEGVYDINKIKEVIYPQLIMKENIDFGPLLSQWSCLYNRKFMEENSIFYNENIKQCEDNYLSSIIGIRMKKFVYMKHFCPYHYMYNPNSISHTYKEQAWGYFCLMNSELKKITHDYNEYDFSRQLDLHILYYTLFSLSQIKKSKLSIERKRILIDDILHEKCLCNSLKKLKLNQLKISWKLKIIIMMIKYKQINLLMLV